MHRVLVEAIPEKTGDIATISGDEAHHALRVKRIRDGAPVELLDGRGGIAAGEVVALDSKPGRELRIRITTVRREEPVRPRVEVWSAVPKGSRIDEMIDQLAQVGAAAWRPLDTSRGIVEPRDAKLERLARIASEASKQCGRAWTMMIGARATMELALRAEPGTNIVLADASSTAWSASSKHSADAIRLLVGPEGGWTPEELVAARSANVTIARFGPHTMRIETAAVVACGIIIAG